MINLLFLMPNLGGGGTERVVTHLAKNLCPEKFKITIALVKPEGFFYEKYKNEINFVHLGGGKVRYSAKKIIKCINDINPDIVFSSIGEFNLLIGLIRPFLSKSTIFVARESNSVTVKNSSKSFSQLRNFLVKMIYKNFDHIIAQCEYMKLDLINNFGILKNSITVINNPVDFEDIIERSQSNNDLTQESRFVAVGRLVDQKGYYSLIDAFSMTNQENTLNILGEGPQKNDIQIYINKLGLSKRVKLLGFKNNSTYYIKHSEALLLSSKYEGFPNVALEAHACGVPVIAYDSPGGTSEIVNASNGILIENNNTEAFATAINELDSYEFNSDDIIRTVKSRYSKEIIIKEYENCLIRISKLKSTHD